MNILNYLLVMPRRRTARPKNQYFGNLLRVLSLLFTLLISGHSHATLILPSVEPQKWYNWYLDFPGPFSTPEDACRNYLDDQNSRTEVNHIHWEFVGLSDKGSTS